MWLLEKPTSKIEFWDWSTAWLGILGCYVGSQFYLHDSMKNNFPQNNYITLMIGGLIGRLIGLVGSLFFSELSDM